MSDNRDYSGWGEGGDLPRWVRVGIVAAAVIGLAAWLCVW